MNGADFFQKKLREVMRAPRIIDIGGGSGYQKGLASLRDEYHGEYMTLDYDAATSPDIVGDILHLPFADNSCDAFLCISVLEHVNDPAQAVRELHRTLRPGGSALLYVPFLYPYHAKEGAYQDFFRFAPDAIRFLFRDFVTLEMAPTRRFFEMWLYMFPRIGRYLAPLGRMLDAWIPSNGNQASGFNIFVVK